MVCVIIFHLSKLWKAKFSILCGVIFMVRLKGKLELDHSWEWKGWNLAVCSLVRRLSPTGREPAYEAKRLKSAVCGGSLSSLLEISGVGMTSRPWPMETAVFDFNSMFSTGFSLRSVRSRFVFLKNLNQDVERILLPLTDLRVCSTHRWSTASLVRQASGLLFYHTKVAFLNNVLDQTAHRGPDQSAPEISIDPLEALEGTE